MIEILFEKNNRFIGMLHSVSALNAVDSNIKIRVFNVSKNIDNSIDFYEFQVFEFFKYSLQSLNSIYKGQDVKYSVDEGSGAPYKLHFTPYNNKLSIAMENGDKIFQGPIEVNIVDYVNALEDATKEFIDYILEKRPDFKNDKDLIDLQHLINTV